MTMAIMAATVWFIPGWLRTAEPHEGIMECVSNAFPEASVEFKAWDGDNLVWPLSVDSADKESWRFAFEIAMMPPEARTNLTLVGHSLGGRITARVLARLAENGLKVRQAILMGAAIPANDPDLAKMGLASELPVLAVCNPKDHVLRYVYATVGGEGAVAFGANGTPTPCANVVECVTPTNITREASIDGIWAKSQALKDIANHHEKFYRRGADWQGDGSAGLPRHLGACHGLYGMVGRPRFVGRMEAREEQGHGPLPHHRSRQASQGVGPRGGDALGVRKGETTIEVIQKEVK